jgi:hypothetical protein
MVEGNPFTVAWASSAEMAMYLPVCCVASQTSYWKMSQLKQYPRATEQTQIQAYIEWILDDLSETEYVQLSSAHK